MSGSIDSPAIEFRNVSLSFDDTLALDDVSFKLGKGEMIILTGLSESGKSVLLRLAIGLLKPDSGQIFLDGREIETLDESDLLAIRGGLMGIVFQEDSLFTGMTVYDNTAYRLEEHGWSETEIEKALREVLEFVGLQGEEDKFPEELSGGMKRRLEIARAMIGWPQIMLYDEPTMSLDPIVAIQVLDLVIRARDINKVSSLYVTKKVHEIPHLANLYASRSSNGEVLIAEAPAGTHSPTRVMVLGRGRIIFAGTGEEFQKSDLPTIRELVTLDHHDHTKDPYFKDPWDKHRHASEEELP
jgi:phospholipid/cholesterol/gamma-HCH transport system ATP-binding protein